MVKRGVSRKAGIISQRELESALVDNFVKMQKVLTNLTIKFEVLADQITKLLQLFEIAARSFVQKQDDKIKDDKDLIKKLDTMLDQNRTIAKGLTLIEEKIRHKSSEEEHRHHSDAELHGLYQSNVQPAGRPTPSNFSRI